MFKINVHKVENHTFILNLEGQLTGTSSAEFHKALMPILQQRPKAISVNLSNVNTIDEAGISMLMNGLIGSPNQGTYFYLIGLPNNVKEYYKARSKMLGSTYFSEHTH